MRLRLAIAAAVLAAASASAQAQTVVGTPPALAVQRLAPQLVAFAGGEVNFTSLVNGLALGLPVTLTSPLGAGLTQVVTFTPAGTMTALQVAQTLEAARQRLISRGIATPTARQIGAVLGADTTVSQVSVPPASAAAGGTTPTSNSPALRNTSDSLFPRGISDTPQAQAPGVTAPAATPGLANPAPRANSPFIGGAPAAGGTAPTFGRPR